jgi:hypothetical protein
MTKRIDQIIERKRESMVIGAWYEMSEDIYWLIARVKRLEDALERIIERQKPALEITSGIARYTAELAEGALNEK